MCATGLIAFLGNVVGQEFTIESEMNIFEQDSGPWSGSHAPTIVQTSDGTIIAAWRRDIDRLSNNEAWMSTFKDGKWTLPRILATGSESGDDHTLENVVLFQPDGGPLMLFYYVGPRSYYDRKDVKSSLSNMWGVLRTSDDNGGTWSKPRPLGRDERVAGGWLCGPTKNPPVQLPDGSILIPSSNEPGLKMTEKGTRELTWHFEKSNDMGKTWFVTQVLPTNPYRAIQPGILTLGNGKLIALGRNEGRGSDTPFAMSRDWGDTWSDISGLKALPQSHSGISVLTLKDGTHVCILNTPTENKWKPRERLDLMVSRNGTDWSLGRILNSEEDGMDANYPQAIQAKDGKIHVVFTHVTRMTGASWRERVIRHMILTTRSSHDRE